MLSDHGPHLQDNLLNEVSVSIGEYFHPAVAWLVRQLRDALHWVIEKRKRMVKNDLKVCPVPGCEFSTRDTSELAEHVNDEHPGEYKRSDWPDLGDV